VQKERTVFLRVNLTMYVGKFFDFKPVCLLLVNIAVLLQC
jgi:hypothetical protein